MEIDQIVVPVEFVKHLPTADQIETLENWKSPEYISEGLNWLTTTLRATTETYQEHEYLLSSDKLSGQCSKPCDPVEQMRQLILLSIVDASLFGRARACIKFV